LIWGDGDLATYEATLIQVLLRGRVGITMMPIERSVIEARLSLASTQEGLVERKTENQYSGLRKFMPRNVGIWALIPIVHRFSSILKQRDLRGSVENG
jgi:hypothetical protein